LARNIISCPVCNNSFHNSTGCGCCFFDNQWEYEYCSLKCWQNSDEYKKVKKLYLKIYNSLSSKEQEIFIDLVDSDLYDFETEHWIEGDK